MRAVEHGRTVWGAFQWSLTLLYHRDMEEQRLRMMEFAIILPRDVFNCIEDAAIRNISCI